MVFHCAISSSFKQRSDRTGGSKLRLLVIDDEQAPRQMLSDVLGLGSHEVVQASGGAEGIQLFGQGGYDAVFTDMDMPETNGADVVRHIRRTSPETPVISVSSKSQEDMETGCEPDAYLVKPYEITEVAPALQAAIEHRRSALTEQNT